MHLHDFQTYHDCRMRESFPSIHGVHCLAHAYMIYLLIRRSSPSSSISLLQAFSSIELIRSSRALLEASSLKVSGHRTENIRNVYLIQFCASSSLPCCQTRRSLCSRAWSFCHRQSYLRGLVSQHSSDPRVLYSLPD